MKTQKTSNSKPKLIPMLEEYAETCFDEALGGKTEPELGCTEVDEAIEELKFRLIKYLTEKGVL